MYLYKYSLQIKCCLPFQPGCQKDALRGFCWSSESHSHVHLHGTALSFGAIWRIKFSSLSISRRLIHSDSFFLLSTAVTPQRTFASSWNVCHMYYARSVPWKRWCRRICSLTVPSPAGCCYSRRIDTSTVWTATDVRAERMGTADSGLSETYWCLRDAELWGFVRYYLNLSFWGWA